MKEKLTRTVFEQSRELEFFTEKELEMQIGHSIDWWPITILRELIDNALDGCENSNISPKIEIEINDNSFTVTDNGTGLSSQVIKKSQDYLKRVSDKAYYVSPTRGQMGNALKVIYAAPYVLNGEYGKVEIWSKGLHHTVEISLDRISQKPILQHSKQKCVVKNGTKIKIYIPNSASLKSSETADFYNPPMTAMELIGSYAAFNPHATFHYDDKTWEATNKKWKKWRSDTPTSPHWYSSETMRNLIAAYIKKENDGGRVMTVREFVSEFKGLSSTIKQKQVTEGFSGIYLHDLVKDNDIDMEFVASLLTRMQEKSKPVKPHVMGVIGEEHLKKQILSFGCTEDSFNYARRKGDDGLPFVMEFAFGVMKEEEANIWKRRIITGLNWSPALQTPAHEIDESIGKMRIDDHDPVILIVHMVKPRFDFTDKGKTRVSL